MTLLVLYFHGTPLAAGWILDCEVTFHFSDKENEVQERKHLSGVTRLTVVELRFEQRSSDAFSLSLAGVCSTGGIPTGFLKAVRLGHEKRKLGCGRE